MSEVFSNNFTSTISDGGDGIDSSQTTIGLADSIPAALTAGNWRLLVGTEIILVTASSGSSITACTRGAEGTAAAAHSESAAVTHILTAGALGEFSQGSGGGAGYGTFSARPASGSAAGELYYCTDSPIVYIWSGSAWRNVIPGVGIFDPLPESGWTEGNMPAEFTLTKEKGIIHIVSDTKDADDWAWIYRSYTAPIVIELVVATGMPTTSYAAAGAGFGDSSTPAKRVLCEVPQTSPGSFRVSRWNNYSSYSAGLKQIYAVGPYPFMLWRFEDDETDISFSCSFDGGLTWPNTVSEARGAFLTNNPDNWGLGLDDNSATAENVSVAFLGYRES